MTVCLQWPLCCIQEFTCRMYGHSERSVNDLRYKMYRASGGVIPGEMLPPRVDSLWQHAEKSNYQCALQRRALESNPIIPSPNGHGWSIDENDIDIVWKEFSPAPDEILYLLVAAQENAKWAHVLVQILVYNAPMLVTAVSVATCPMMC